MSEVRKNGAESRYELEVDGDLAIAVYRRQGDVVAFMHTEVPVGAEGHGVGSKLVKAALDDVRGQGLKVVPACEFVAAYMQEHPDEQDLLADDQGVIFRMCGTAESGRTVLLRPARRPPSSLP